MIRRPSSVGREAGLPGGKVVGARRQRRVGERPLGSGTTRRRRDRVAPLDFRGRLHVGMWSLVRQEDRSPRLWTVGEYFQDATYEERVSTLHAAAAPTLARDGRGMSGGTTEICGLRVSGPLSPVGRTASGTADLIMEAGPVSAEGSVAGLKGNGRW